MAIKVLVKSIFVYTHVGKVIRMRVYFFYDYEQSFRNLYIVKQCCRMHSPQIPAWMVENILPTFQLWWSGHLHSEEDQSIMVETDRKELSKTTKLRVYSAIVESTLLYGCETWTLQDRHKKKLQAPEIRYLRKAESGLGMGRIRSDDIQ